MQALQFKALGLFRIILVSAWDLSIKNGGLLALVQTPRAVYLSRLGYEAVGVNGPCTPDAGILVRSMSPAKTELIEDYNRAFPYSQINGTAPPSELLDKLNLKILRGKNRLLSITQP